MRRMIKVPGSVVLATVVAGLCVLSMSEADSLYDRIDLLCARDSPESTPFDGLDPIKADEYRMVFRLGYFKAWDRHLG